MRIEETGERLAVVEDLRLNLLAAGVPLNGMLYGIYTLAIPLSCRPPTAAQMAIFWAIWIVGDAILLTRSYLTSVVCDKGSNTILFAKKRLFGGEERVFSIGEVKSAGIEESVWKNCWDVVLQTAQGPVKLFTTRRAEAEDIHSRIAKFLPHPPTKR